MTLIASVNETALVVFAVAFGAAWDDRSRIVVAAETAIDKVHRRRAALGPAAANTGLAFALLALSLGETAPEGSPVV